MSKEESTDQLDTPISSSEKRVYDLVVLGFSHQEVADKLFLSTTTVKFHLNAIRRKKGLTSTKEIIALHHMGKLKYLEARSPWNIGQKLKVTKSSLMPEDWKNGEVVKVARAYPAGIADTRNRLYINKELEAAG